MIFTVGDTENYTQAIVNAWQTDDALIYKQGIRDNYPGGIVFQCKVDAEAYLKKVKKEDYWSVWGVDADWCDHTYLHQDGTRHLSIDRPIIDIREWST